MLRLEGVRAECLFDEVLPGEVRELPEDLARLDELLADPALLAPIEAHWRGEAKQRGRSSAGHGRPTIPMSTYVRLMVVKQRTGWGYETLVKEVSDSLHLRRFRPRAARIDSTVVEADVRYPSDGMLCLQGARALARQGGCARSRAPLPAERGRRASR